MFVTIVICTRNRADSLRRAVESVLCPGNLAAGPAWELLVVDNGSTDGTAQICREFEERFPNQFRFLMERRVGKSHALNTAIIAAKGEVLAFTDDDVLCSPDYIEAIRTVFTSVPADAAQGRVLLDCEGGWPEWLDEKYVMMADLRDFGDKIIPLDGTICGSNMIVRADVFQKVGGFAPELGPGGTGLGVFEDTEISLRMRRKGYRLIYAPQILVRHQWTRDRLTKRFVRRRMFLHGRVNAYYDKLPVSLPRFAMYVIKETVVKELLALWQRCSGRPAMALHSQCEAREQAGFLWQHWLFRRGTPRKFSSSLPLPTEGAAITSRQSSHRA